MKNSNTIQNHNGTKSFRAYTNHHLLVWIILILGVSFFLTILHFSEISPMKMKRLVDVPCEENSSNKEKRK